MLKKVYKKLILVLLSTIILTTTLFALIACDNTTNTTNSTNNSSPTNPFNDTIRLHIRANSNTTQDQSIKYKVRDNVLDFLASELGHITQLNTAKRYIRARLNRINTIATTTLRQNNFLYSANSYFAVSHFPRITYQFGTLQAGYYHALIIKLGKSNGNNWWCVIYPPLCFVPSFNQSGTEGFRYRSFFWDRIRGH